MDLIEGKLSRESVIARLQKRAAKPSVVPPLLSGSLIAEYIDGTCGEAFELNERIEKVMKVYSPCLPLVDARSKIIFMLYGAGHGAIQYVLSEIYFPDPEGTYNPPKVRKSRWLKNGCGWYISTMDPYTIVVHEKYRPQDYEAPVFQQFHVQWENF